MLREGTVLKINELKSLGHSHAEISRLLQISYPTILKYLRPNIPPVNRDASPMDPADASPLLKPFMGQITTYVRNGVTSSKKMELLLRAHGYMGSYQILNNYLRNRREYLVLERANSYYRVETEPGEQAQVDWGHFGQVEINGMAVNLYAFALILSHSRALYAEFVTSQRQKTLQDCHIKAFKYLGGVPQKIRYDNMKTVVISRSNDDKVVNWNFEFKNFAQYYHFEPELCPKYYPRSKGKVEAAIKFLRNNFFNGEVFGKTFRSVDEINGRLSDWLNHYANQRPHPVTGVKISDIWQSERSVLSSIEDDADFSNFAPQIRRVSHISMVTYKRAFYWVPKEYIQHKVEVREIMRDGQMIVEFYAKKGKIYEHPLAPPGKWFLPGDRDQIKIPGKERERRTRIFNNPIYRTLVEVRDLTYYSKLLNKTHGKKENS